LAHTNPYSTYDLVKGIKTKVNEFGISFCTFLSKKEKNPSLDGPLDVQVAFCVLVTVSPVSDRFRKGRNTFL